MKSSKICLRHHHVITEGLSSDAGGGPSCGWYLEATLHLEAATPCCKCCTTLISSTDQLLVLRPSPSRFHLATLQRIFAFLAFSEWPSYSQAEFRRTTLPP